MKAKRTLFKILFLATLLVVVSGFAILLIAANKKDEGELCKGVIVTIDSEENEFVDKNDVLKMVHTSAKGLLVNKPIASINTQVLEKDLELNSWIEDAQLYYDSKSNLQIQIKERKPIARIFTTAGNSFFIDSVGVQLPLLENKPIRVHVVTGFTPAKRWNSKDSAVLDEVKKVVQFISKHDFWNAQVGEIQIVQNGFHLTPVIGDHVIKLGSAENLEDKLTRLFIFYKQVLSKTGFNKYQAVDVRFDGQVIGVKKGPASKVDEALLKKNIEQLMRRKEQQVENAVDVEQERTNTIKKASEIETSKNIKPLRENSVPVKTNILPVKEIEPAVKPVIEKNKIDQLKKSRKPKAVMERKVKVEKVEVKYDL
ncbi:MAG TPA: hypothetical protein VM368_02435 [Flavisolibacter sp.]|nr:hypothetical protein [Flavisolibacter sp.]